MNRLAVAAAWASLLLPRSTASTEEARWAAAGRQRPLVIVDGLRPLMGAIARIEGWEAEDAPVRRWRNPGALKFAGQEGATENAAGYAVFETEEQGWDALRADLVAKRHRGVAGVREIAWARCGTDPACDAAAYAALLCRLAGDVECAP